MQSVSELSRDLVLEVSQKLNEPPWLLENRLAAWEAFAKLPYPTLKTEEWRYTDISKVPFETLALERPSGQKLSREALPAEIKARLEQSQLAGFAVFVGADLVYLELPEELRAKGVVLTTLAEALNTHAGPIRQALFRAVGWKEKLTAYNAALFTHGAFLFVPQGVEFDTPLGVFHYLGGGQLSIGRTLIVAEANSKAVYIEEYVSPTAVDLGVNLSVSELILGQGAQLRHAHVQTLALGFYHFHRTRAVLERDARLNDLTATFGGTLARTETQSELAGPGADSEMLGLYFAHGEQHLDHYTLQHHAEHHTKSDLLYKGAVKDQAHTVYSGLIKLEEAAQKADAYQSNRNLLLSSEARVESIPQLEIAANEVRCTHGSTTAPVDEMQLFYLMSRGVPKPVAQQVLVKAHLYDVLTRIPLLPLREHIERVIEEKVRL
ncbi:MULTISPECIES: Fe-S cluster assembly protein SufD [unclassified Meiothermus]|uniref:Fe-S cluster assembly protein SufD n=1 Tax=unclassified Meiothermus TaxID=370471 RepID=UPI000D7CCEC0|nr:MULTISPECIES: Fe-S cluster assembly protein SufD [unclassified Meiothermus]PZA07387.1 Fe-S cluster assembly protein SufD [Meiothermus sp. Pnk-1]RYM38034.1 Fe-S cluster assembly protein SufD [Meiothermus sp. PNK-Is4]